MTNIKQGSIIKIKLIDGELVEGKVLTYNSYFETGIIKDNLTNKKYAFKLSIDKFLEVLEE